MEVLRSQRPGRILGKARRYFSNGRTLADIEQEEKKLKADFEDFVGSTIKTLQILIVNDKQKQKKIDALEKALADFMAQIIKGGN